MNCHAASMLGPVEGWTLMVSGKVTSERAVAERTHLDEVVMGP